ncbi:extracellular serine-rich protein [Moniliophthora roreri]|nr:extracellular serine-rich protein [Moniliophthora roreri]
MLVIWRSPCVNPRTTSAELEGESSLPLSTNLKRSASARVVQRMLGNVEFLSPNPFIEPVFQTPSRDQSPPESRLSARKSSQDDII